MAYCQTKAIRIEHFGPQDGGIPTVTIIRDSNMLDAFVRNHNSETLVIDYSSTHDFDVLEQILLKELSDSSDVTSQPTWGNMKITIYDAEYNQIACRHMCCDQDSAAEFRRLAQLPLVVENDFIVSKLMMYVGFIEADLEHR